MSKKSRFSLSRRFKSFQYAINGVRLLWLEEHNFRLHLVAAVLVIAASFYFQISTSELLFVVLSIAFVMASEAFNSALENMADAMTQEYHPQIKKLKDISAAAVLISAISAFIVGSIIFLPKVLDKMSAFLN